MSTTTSDLEGGANPFMNAQLEIKIDELLNPKVASALEDAGSSLTVSVSKTTLRQLQTLVWDSIPGLDLISAEKAVLTAVEGLGLTIREDAAEPEEDDGAQ